MRILKARGVQVLVAVAVLVLVAGILPSAAGSKQRTPTRSVSGGKLNPPPFDALRRAALGAVARRMVVAPREQALVRGLPVRVAVRVPAGTTRFWVLLNGRKVSARFHRGGGSLRVGLLRRSDGLGYGPNDLLVVVARRGARSVSQARSFILTRSPAGFLALGVRPGAETAVDLRVGASGLAQARQERRVGMWLNGRSVNRALESPQPTHWTASLSAAQGLRYGVNSLRVRVLEPDTGRLESLHRSFVVARTHDLAAAGSDIPTRVGERVRLDGQGSRTDNGAPPRYRWRILSRPRGSRAALSAVATERPHFTPDRRGEYVIGLTVSSALQSGAKAETANTDTVTVTAEPSSLLVPFTGTTVKDGRPGINVGGHFYPNTSPSGHAMQWLTLDRSTLTAIRSGNSWLSGGADGPNGLNAFKAALSSGGLGDLVILSYPRGGSDPPVQEGQIDAFNQAAQMLGVGPIDKGILKDRNKLVVVGVPYGGDGSGWYIHGGTEGEGLKGWLMPDATPAFSGALRFRLSPDRPAFDTSSSSSFGSNTMTVGDQQITDSVHGEGCCEGFQVALIDPTDFRVTDHKAFSLVDLDEMAKFLNEHRGDYRELAVQSIGHVQAGQGATDTFFARVADALQAYGANPDTFFRADGSYAYLGSRLLPRSDDADSSSATVLDQGGPRPLHESGKLRGRASMLPDGYYAPLVADPVGLPFNLKLYDIVFRPSTPWPYTETAGGPHTENYAKALAHISESLPEFRRWAPDLRQAYSSDLNVNYSDAKSDLLRLRYPGDGTTCLQKPGTENTNPGYTRAEFCQLSDELEKEFEWLNGTNAVFNAYEKALSRSGPLARANLERIGEDLRTAIAPPDNSAQIGWTIGSFVGRLVQAGLVLGGVGPGVMAAWQALVAVYELVRQLASETGGVPVGDQIKTKVRELDYDVANQLADTANGLDRVHQVINSDYGRLEALGKVAYEPGWTLDVATATTRLNTAARGSFSTALMPLPYGVYALYPINKIQIEPPTPDTCVDPKYGDIWVDAPATAWHMWTTGFQKEGHARNRAAFVLGTYSLGSRKDYPPPKLTNAMFRSPEQGGYGIRLSTFMWTAYENHPGAPPTDLGACGKR